MKKRLLMVMSGIVLVVGLAACSSKEESKPSESTNQAASGDSAETIFKQSCASCHGDNLQGRVGPNLQKAGSKFSQAEIEKIIAKGRGSMPAGMIQGEDAKKVAEWLSQKK